MRKSLPERQKWLEHALQGLAFWIGHRHSLFSGYPLTEGALVAEACNLIQANLPPDLILLPERMYRNLVPNGTQIKMSPGSRVPISCFAMKARGRSEGTIIFPHMSGLLSKSNADRRPTEISIPTSSGCITICGHRTTTPELFYS